MFSKWEPYIPQDRLKALACGKNLELDTNGTACFIDISGFTSIMENYSITLGYHRLMFHVRIRNILQLDFFVRPGLFAKIFF